MKDIEYREWDATQPVNSSRCIIVHVVNDIGAWGKGFVLALERQWPGTKRHYKVWIKTSPALGETLNRCVGNANYIINLLAQRGLRSAINPIPIDYKALRKALAKTQLTLGGPNNTYTVQMPRIGCGLAGGDWAVVEQIIIEELSSKNQHVVVCDMPKKNPTA